MNNNNICYKILGEENDDINYMTRPSILNHVMSIYELLSYGIYWLTLVIAHDHSYYVFLIDILYYFMIHYFVLTSPIYYILYLNLCAIYFIYHLLLIINGTS